MQCCVGIGQMIVKFYVFSVHGSIELMFDKKVFWHLRLTEGFVEGDVGV